MEYKDIQDALSALARITGELEEKYIESDGEVTPEAEAMEEEKEALKALLQGEGIDLLGRWLKAKEDEVKSLKAEKAAAERRLRCAENSAAFVKAKITEVMLACGMKAAKGTYYSFTHYVSERTSLDAVQMDERWLDAVTEAARNAGLPDYIDVALKTTATRVREWAQTHEGQGDMYLITDTADAVRFTKPRKPREE